MVPAEVAADRFERLRVVVERSALARHQARVGRVEEILVEGPSKRDPGVSSAAAPPRASWSTSRRRPGTLPGRHLGRRPDHQGRPPLPRRASCVAVTARPHAPHPHPGGRRLSRPRPITPTGTWPWWAAPPPASRRWPLESPATSATSSWSSVDSMQVYRGMDIGTAKPTRAERAEVPHHLLDLADPAEEWSVTRWAAAARQALAGIEARGHRALLVGGTGLYFQALVDDLEPPGQYPAVRAQLARGAGHQPSCTGGWPRSTRWLPPAWSPPTGAGCCGRWRSPSAAAAPSPVTARAWPASRRRPGDWRGVVAAPAGRRRPRSRPGSTAMVAAGLVDEVEPPAAPGPGGMSRTARQALGYREVLAHLEDGVPLTEAVAEAERRTRAFARRQRVWWRRDPRIRWYGAVDNPFAVMPLLLGQWRDP